MIVNAYSYRNAGDAAIMLSTAKLLRELGYDDVILSTRYVEDRDAYESWGVDVQPPLIAFPTNGSYFWRSITMILGTIAAFAATMGPRVAPRRHPRSTSPTAIEQARVCDLLVIAGGGYFYSAKRKLNWSFLHSALTAAIGRRLCSNVIMMPMSIGPISSRLDAWIVTRSLAGVRTALREELSLVKSKVRPVLAPLSVVPDVAFLGPPSTTDHKLQERNDRGAPSAPLARIVALDWSWSRSVSNDDIARYVDNVAKVADRLAEMGWLVVLGGHSSIPEQGQDDVEMARRIAQSCRGRVTVDDNCDVGHLWGAYRESSVVLGTRLHACIMALSLGTPAVALAYQEKAFGVMSEFSDRVPVFWADRFDPGEVAAAVTSSLNSNFSDDLVKTVSRIRAHYA